MPGPVTSMLGFLTALTVVYTLLNSRDRDRPRAAWLLSQVWGVSAVLQEVAKVHVTGLPPLTELLMRCNPVIDVALLIGLANIYGSRPANWKKALTLLILAQVILHVSYGMNIRDKIVTVRYKAALNILHVLSCVCIALTETPFKGWERPKWR